MRVLIITNSLSGGGAERSMNTLVNHLKLKVDSLTLVTVNEGREDLISVQSNVLKLERRKAGGISELMRVLWLYGLAVRRLKPEFVIANCDLPEVLSLFSPLRAKLIVVEHSNPSWINRPMIGTITRILLNLRRAQFVAVSNHLLIWPFRKKPHSVIENSLTLYDVQLKSVRSKKVERLWFVGRLDSTQKRPEFVLEIAKSTGLGVSFIGEGSARPKLQTQASPFGVKVEFYGALKNPWSVVNRREILIVPSLFEGDGLVVLEAMLNSMPILISNNSAFARFNLPKQNVCESVYDFIDRVNHFKARPEELIVPESIFRPIVEGRNGDFISSEWLNYLTKLSESKS